MGYALYKRFIKTVVDNVLAVFGINYSAQFFCITAASAKGIV
jgi:hypothetical protein